MWRVVLLALVGCGRVGFEPIAGGDAIASSGDGAGGDGAGGDGGMVDTAVDALPAACANAMSIGIGRTVTLDTCAMTDMIDGCGPPGTREIIFRFDPPASAGYTFRAYDGATQNTSNSTALLNATCTATMGCSGVLGTGVTAGQPVFIIVEAASGGCAQIQYSIQ